MGSSRRRFLETAARAAALPGAVEFFAAWLPAAQNGEGHHHASSTAPPDPGFFDHYTPKFFDPEDFAALQSFTEILIPTDDTPGAREAHCAHYIDFVQQASTPKTQQQWRDAMAKLKQAGYHSADARGKAELIEAMSMPERHPPAEHPAFSAYLLIKQLNTYAFYTSRAGMIEALDYRGNSYNVSFPACTHPEHQKV